MELLLGMRLVPQQISGTVQETTGHYWIQAPGVTITIEQDTVAGWSDPIPALVEVRFSPGTASTITVVGTGYIYSASKVLNANNSNVVLLPTSPGNLRNGVIGSRIFYSPTGNLITPRSGQLWAYNNTANGMNFANNGGVGDVIATSSLLSNGFYNNSFPIAGCSTKDAALGGFQSFFGPASLNYLNSINASGSQNLIPYSITNTPAEAKNAYFGRVYVSYSTAANGPIVIAIGTVAGKTLGRFAPYTAGQGFNAAGLNPAVWTTIRLGNGNAAGTFQIDFWWQFPNYNLPNNSSLVIVPGIMEQPASMTCHWYATTCILPVVNTANQTLIGMA